MSAPPAPTPTPLSLLRRLRQPGDADAWACFARLYTPLLFAWARRAGLDEADAADLVQDVFVVLVRALPEFRYKPGGSFRAWLRTILLNKWREQRRRRALATAQGYPVEEVAAPPADDPLDDPASRAELVRRALEPLRDEFAPTTWKAFHETVLGNRAPREVAAELGVSLNAVYIARSRVLQRLRQELDGLIE